MNQFQRTVQTIVDCQEDTLLVQNPKADQQVAADSITATSQQNTDQLPIVCIDDAVGIINWQWQQR